MTSRGSPARNHGPWSVEEYPEAGGHARAGYWDSSRQPTNSTRRQIIGSVSESYPSTGLLFGSEENSSSLPMSFSDVSVGNCRIERNKAIIELSGSSTLPPMTVSDVIETPMKMIEEIKDPGSETELKSEEMANGICDTATTVAADGSPSPTLPVLRLENIMPPFLRDDHDRAMSDRREMIEIQHTVDGGGTPSHDNDMPLCLGGSAPASYFSQSESGPDDLAIGGVVEENGKLKLIGGHENENENTTWLCYRLPADYLTRKRSTLWLHPRIANENGWLTRLGHRPCPIIKARMYSSDTLLFTVPRPVYAKMVAWGHYRCEVTMERRMRYSNRVCGLTAVDRPSMYLVRLCCAIIILCIVTDLIVGLYVIQQKILKKVWYIVMVFSLDLVCIIYPYIMAKCWSFGVMRALWTLVALGFLGTKVGLFAYEMVLIIRRDHVSDDESSNIGETDAIYSAQPRRMMAASAAPPTSSWLAACRDLLLGRWDSLDLHRSAAVQAPRPSNPGELRASMWHGLGKPEMITLAEPAVVEPYTVETPLFDSPITRLLTPSTIAPRTVRTALTYDSTLSPTTSPSLFSVTIALVMCMVTIMGSLLNLGICHVLAQLYKIEERQIRIVHFHQKGYRKLCTAPFELWCAGLFTEQNH